MMGNTCDYKGKKTIININEVEWTQTSELQLYSIFEMKFKIVDID